ncbi:MAG: hypothetical protein JWM11_3436 [Planctomycetaceae bacterium]|nr:hypothetical protein [Planctomycetaceae bacterium]
MKFYPIRLFIQFAATNESFSILIPAIKRLILNRAWFIVILVVGIARPVVAQPLTHRDAAGSGVVSGTGMVQLERIPEILRMQVQLTSKGATLKEALTALKARSDAARLQLATMGAEKESIKIDASRIAVQDPNRRNAMEMMLAQQMKRGAKGAAKSKPVAPVEVTASLSAEWKLTVKDAETLLLAVHPLQEKIRAADLAGKAETEKLTPEQEEMLEELQASGQNRFGQNDQETQGQPDFLFVSHITEAEHEKAMAEAFQKAQARASRFAKAAGCQLGAVRSIESSDGPSMEYEDYSMRGYGSSQFSLLQQAARQHSGSTDLPEAVGATASKVKYAVNLTATFELKPLK